MNVTDFQEVWQVDTGGQVFEARFEEMAQWIYDGAILPQDLVRRGNLRWIEAQKVPALNQFFNAREQGAPPPVLATTTDAQNFTQKPSEPQNFAPNPFQNNFNQTAPNNFQPKNTSNFQNQTSWQQPQHSPQPEHFYEPQPQFMPQACSIHIETAAVFICDTCANGFCPACPKSYGGSVKICPFCGAMCKSIKEIAEKTQKSMQFQGDLSKGFGFEDFFQAVAYPFKFKSSLMMGAIMFMLFSLGQSATSLANMYMAAGALFCWMITNTLTFGILMNVLDDFAQGKVGNNFMPSFEDFSLWDSVVHPFFLFLGTYLVSFGLLFLFVGAVVWFTWTTFNGKPPLSFEDKIKVAQYEKEKREGKFYGDPNNPNPVGSDEQKLVNLQKELQNQRQKEMESVAGKTVEQEESDQRELANNFVKIGTPAIIIALILFLWGIFYYPAACLVAGYTRSFAATLKPNIGIETIKILGVDYLKVQAMCLSVTLAAGLIGLILNWIFRAFHLPGIGNLPATAIGALFTFYLSIVYAMILGFALYKNSDKLNLFKG